MGTWVNHWRSAPSLMLRQICLSDHEPDPDADQSNPKPPKYDNLLTRLVGHNAWRTPWGGNVQHIRIDNLRMQKLSLGYLAESLWGIRNVKVLVCRPNAPAFLGSR